MYFQKGPVRSLEGCLSHTIISNKGLNLATEGKWILPPQLALKGSDVLQARLNRAIKHTKKSLVFQEVFRPHSRVDQYPNKGQNLASEGKKILPTQIGSRGEWCTPNKGLNLASEGKWIPPIQLAQKGVMYSKPKGTCSVTWGMLIPYHHIK